MLKKILTLTILTELITNINPNNCKILVGLRRVLHNDDDIALISVILDYKIKNCYVIVKNGYVFIGGKNGMWASMAWSNKISGKSSWSSFFSSCLSGEHFEYSIR